MFTATIVSIGAGGVAVWTFLKTLATDTKGVRKELKMLLTGVDGVLETFEFVRDVIGKGDAKGKDGVIFELVAN